MTGTTKLSEAPSRRLDTVQVRNPITERYVKVDTRTGRILAHKKSPGPYKGIKELTRKKG